MDYKSGVEGAAIAQLAGNLRSEWAETHEKTGENLQNRKLLPLKVMDQGAPVLLPLISTGYGIRDWFTCPIPAIVWLLWDRSY